LERKFEILLLAENARMELESSANESGNLPSASAPIFIAVQAEITRFWRLEGKKKDQIRTKEGPKKDQRRTKEGS
jgi:hypothetical protein